MSPAPVKRHQLIPFAVTKAIETFAEVNGGDMIVSPTDVHLATNVVLQPDTGYVAAGGPTTFDDHVVGPPALILEVLSPGTSAALHDRKMRKYALHGVPEAWVIDPSRSTVLVLRNEDGAWQESGRVTFGEDIPSQTVRVGDAGLAKFLQPAAPHSGGGRPNERAAHGSAVESCSRCTRRTNGASGMTGLPAFAAK